VLFIIRPEDESTNFLVEIPDSLHGKYGNAQVTILHVAPNVQSYEECVLNIQRSPSGSTFLFLGHGQDECILGAGNSDFQKRPLINKGNIASFSEKNLFSLSCYSSTFLRSTFRHSRITNSIGFGNLPTEMAEVVKVDRLVKAKIDEEILANFREILVKLIISSFSHFIESGCSFIDLGSYFILQTNRIMTDIIMGNKENESNRILADLLFETRKDIAIM
jgi:hypothetical protein